MTASMEDIGIYRRMVALYYQTAESLRGQQFPSNQMDFWSGLIGKVGAHALSILALHGGTRVTGLPFDVSFSDPVSVGALTRAAMEAYASLYYLFFDSLADDDERSFRFAYEQMRGLLIRQAIDVAQIRAQRLQEQAIIDQLFQEIQNTTFFRTLSGDRRLVNQIRRGRYERFNKVTMVTRAGFSERNARIFYAYLSDSVHSGYLSVLQLSQATTQAAQARLMSLGIRLTAIVLALSVRNIMRTFPATQTAVPPGSLDLLLVDTLCATAADPTLFQEAAP